MYSKITTTHKLRAIVISALLCALLVAGGCTLRNTGWALAGAGDKTLSIDTGGGGNGGDIKVCCVYVDSQGSEKTCSVLQRYNCSFHR